MGAGRIEGDNKSVGNAGSKDASLKKKLYHGSMPKVEPVNSINRVNGSYKPLSPRTVRSSISPKNGNGVNVPIKSQNNGVFRTPERKKKEKEREEEKEKDRVYSGRYRNFKYIIVRFKASFRTPQKAKYQSEIN